MDGHTQSYIQRIEERLKRIEDQRSGGVSRRTLPTFSSTSYEEIESLKKRLTAIESHERRVRAQERRTEFPSLIIGNKLLGNYTSISADGFVELHGDAAPLNDVNIPMTAYKLGGVNDPTWVQFMDDGSSSTGVYCYYFDNGEELFFSFAFGHAMKENTVITPYVHYSVPDTTAGTIVWQAECTWANVGSAYGNTVTHSVSFQSPKVVKQHHVVEFDPITPLSGQGGHDSLVLGRISRGEASDGDTYTNKVYMLGFAVHVQVNGFGSQDV